MAIKIGLGAGAGRVWLVGYDARHVTRVGRGENAGETLVESNIVRSLTALGAWDGSVLELQHAAAGRRAFCGSVQAADGRILGAAREQ